jgi:hypothetical protein
MSHGKDYRGWRFERYARDLVRNIKKGQFPHHMEHMPAANG